MATIASLLVNLGMNTASFTTGAKKSKSTLDSLAKSAFVLNNVIGAARGAADVVEGLVSAFTKQSEVIDEIGKFSEKTGFSTENLAALRHNADLSGVAISTLDSGLQKLSINLGKAAQKSDESSNGFTKLGLNVQDLLAMSPDDAFAKIADSIAALPTPAAKSAAAVEIFGKSGADLLPILSQGSAGLAEMRAEADRLGLTFSKLDASQIEAANDELARAQKIFEGLKIDATIASAPFVQAGAAVAQDFIHGFKENLFSLESLALGPILGPYVKSIRNVSEELTSVEAAQRDAASMNRSAAEDFSAVAEAAKEYAKALKAIESAISKNDSLIAQYATPEEQFRSRIAELEKAIANADAAMVSETEKHGLMPDDPKARERQQRIAGQRDDLRIAMQRASQQQADDWLGDFFKGFDRGGKAKIQDPRELRLDAIQDHLGILRQESDLDSFRGNERAGALERGSSAAFSASFGQTGLDRQQAEIIRLEREMVSLLREIKRTTATTVTLGP